MKKVTSFSRLPEWCFPVLDIDLKHKGTLMIIKIGSLLMIIGFAVGYVIYKKYFGGILFWDIVVK
ncbi:MAG: hypothetical protein WCZ19_04545 [Acholeplasma sp.]